MFVGDAVAVRQSPPRLDLRLRGGAEAVAQLVARLLQVRDARLEPLARLLGRAPLVFEVLARRPGRGPRVALALDRGGLRRGRFWRAAPRRASRPPVPLESRSSTRGGASTTPLRRLGPPRLLELGPRRLERLARPPQIRVGGFG